MRFVDPNEVRMSFRMRVVNEDAFALYQEHRAAWQSARDELLTTPWWHIIKRARLSRAYSEHLYAACDMQLEAIAIERVI